MKRLLLTLTSILFVLSLQAQFKVHSDGQISFQSLNTSDGVQINPLGISSFEPNITLSFTPLTQTKITSDLVRAWLVRYDKPDGSSISNVRNRFYVTGIGDTYSTGDYTISPGGGGSKGYYPIENASELISNLNGYYYDYNEFEGFVPDFENNPNVAPEAIEGLMKDLAIDKIIGLSYEDVETVLPEAIRHDPDGMVCINYQALVPVLIEAFKEQQARIEELESILKKNGLLKP